MSFHKALHARQYSRVSASLWPLLWWVGTDFAYLRLSFKDNTIRTFADTTQLRIKVVDLVRVMGEHLNTKRDLQIMRYLHGQRRWALNEFFFFSCLIDFRMHVYLNICNTCACVRACLVYLLFYPRVHGFTSSYLSLSHLSWLSWLVLMSYINMSD